MSRDTLLLLTLACAIACATAVPFLHPETTSEEDYANNETETGDYVYPEYPEYPVKEEEYNYEDHGRKYECSNNGDCPAYHYCFHSLWFGA